MELRDGAGFSERRRGLEECRESGGEIDSRGIGIEIAAANLILAADVPIDGHDGVVGVIEERRGERERADRDLDSFHSGGAVSNRGYRNVLFENSQICRAQSADAIQQSDARGGWRGNSLAWLRGLAERAVFIVAEVEQLVFNNRSADSGAQAVGGVAG